MNEYDKGKQIECLNPDCLSDIAIGDCIEICSIVEERFQPSDLPQCPQGSSMGGMSRTNWVFV